jgi:hypothetical protein
VSELCHIPPKTLQQHRHFTVTCRFTSLSREARSELRWWNLVSVSTRERNQLPIVLV